MFKIKFYWYKLYMGTIRVHLPLDNYDLKYFSKIYKIVCLINAL